ncbi:hypothetical protein Nepgr_026653 [Nepenthes gracilis]|uniref:Uncharacterized protein n=1 Tax=Nepenthes gracilis TaxID=150966 RepID=A0AAD3Y285_NEPGR|nr:hypothetical protein Nepgr_026653 [Nepenthes gracilis]
MASKTSKHRTERLSSIPLLPSMEACDTQNGHGGINTESEGAKLLAHPCPDSWIDSMESSRAPGQDEQSNLTHGGGRNKIGIMNASSEMANGHSF